MLPSKDTAIVSEGQALLTSRFRQLPNIRGLLAVFLGSCQELENVLWDVIEKRWLATAVAANPTGLVSDQLDKLGALVGQPRIGLNNASYGQMILLRIRANRSQGRAEDIIQLAQALEYVGKAGVPTPGVPAYSTTSASFLQPAAGANVTVAMASTAWLGVGLGVVVAGGGTYSVAAIVDGTHATLTNTGATGNAAAGATVASGARVSLAGASNYYEAWPAGVVVEIFGLTIGSLAAQTALVAIELLAQAKPAGVRGMLHYSIEPEANVLEYASHYAVGASGNGVWHSHYGGVSTPGNWAACAAIA